jgi:hypothetical protein
MRSYLLIMITRVALAETVRCRSEFETHHTLRAISAFLESKIRYFVYRKYSYCSMYEY